MSTLTKQNLKEVADFFGMDTEDLKGNEGESIEGPQGEKGNQGDKGDKGDKGETGKQGIKGRQGTKSKDGLDGFDGVDGKNGKDGSSGLDGKDGLDGKNGKDGKVTAGGSGYSWLQRKFDLKVHTQTAATRNHFATTGSEVILCDCTSNAITVNLPSAAGNLARLTIKKIDSSGNAVTVDGAGSETIDGSTTSTISAQYESVTIVSDNNNWHIV